MDLVYGMDVSMLHELEEHGASYALHGQRMDLFEIFRCCGVNLVRLRLWQDPYTADGVRYGGGTNDLPTTCRLARRAVQQGLAFMLDFHYSDFWCDPSKQTVPKAWRGQNADELAVSVYTYTKQVLTELRQAGLAPQYVQVGNEITNGLLWPEGHADHPREMAKILAAGIRGVRETVPGARIILHLDFGTDKALYRRWFEQVAPYRLDFDIVGMSYYPYFNGSLEKLFENLCDTSARLGKDVLVVETSIGYTGDDLGCEGMLYTAQMAQTTGYPATQAGQKQFLDDLIRTVQAVPDGHGLGFVYWAPEWLPIPECMWTQEEGFTYINDKGAPANCWANQALFDAHGNANLFLESLAQASGG